MRYVHGIMDRIEQMFDLIKVGISSGTMGARQGGSQEEARSMGKKVEYRQCTGQTRDGRPCRGLAQHGSEPPRCRHHAAEPRAAPASCPAPSQEAGGAGGFYARDPELVTIGQAIAGLVDKMARLDRVIADLAAEAHEADPRVVKAIEVYTQSSSRLSRLLRDRRALTGDSGDDIPAAIARALEELGDEWGVDLLTPRY